MAVRNDGGDAGGVECNYMYNLFTLNSLQNQLPSTRAFTFYLPAQTSRCNYPPHSSTNQMQDMPELFKAGMDSCIFFILLSLVSTTPH